MKTVTIPLGGSAALTAYLWEPSEELDVEKRPAVLVLPGGAYSMCAQLEGEPVALAFLAKGFQAFVLRYTTRRQFEPALNDALAAMDLIRKNAADWQVDSGRIAVCGFSAGGHLACALGTMAEQKPRALVLGYPAVVGEDWKHYGLEMVDMLSKVDENTPPTFLFACRDDDELPVHDATRLADALERHGVDFECHIFRRGGHGFGLGVSPAGYAPVQRRQARVSAWFELAVSWLKETMG